MALFRRGDDANVAYLTRLLQVEPKEYDQFFWWAETGNEFSGGKVDIRLHLEADDEMRAVKYEDARSQFFDVQRLAHETMNDLAESDNEGASWGAYTDFMFRVSEQLHMGITVIDDQGQNVPTPQDKYKTMDQRAIIPRRFVKPATMGTEWRAIAWAWRDLYTLWITPTIMVGLCPECSFPYIRVGRSDQNFCSNRCRIRRNSRETYQRKNAEEDELLTSSDLLTISD